MRPQRMTVTVPFELEEFGSNQQVHIVGNATFHVYPPEPRTWDYPGSPPCSELLSVEVEFVEANEYRVVRAARPDWFRSWDEAVFVHILGHDDAHELAIFRAEQEWSQQEIHHGTFF